MPCWQAWESGGVGVWTWIEDLGLRVEETRLDVEKKKKNRDVEPEHGKV